MVKEDLIQDIQKKRANIAVIGMGYVGLPLAVTFANAGFSVTGIDPCLLYTSPSPRDRG